MSADPLIYCLQQVSDYSQFERLATDIMALDGYRGLEPLGGMQDKGRDAIYVDRTTGSTTIFAFSVREDWRVKLAKDAQKVADHGHPCRRFAFICTANFTAAQRDEAVTYVHTTHGWPLDLFGLERLAVLLRTSHRELVAQHPQIFCQPFFPQAGGLSLSPARDHVIIDHIDHDTALAHWLTRRLLLLGYRVWCRGLAPVVGSSVSQCVRDLVARRAVRYVCLLSPRALADPDFTARRHSALSYQGLTLPAVSVAIDRGLLDQETRGLEAARFDQNWAAGLRQIDAVLQAAQCPREPQGTQQIALSSCTDDHLVINEPETIASNLFEVTRLPVAIRRYHSRRPLVAEHAQLAACWAYKQVEPTCFLAFHDPPEQLRRTLSLSRRGGSNWQAVPRIDGIATRDVVRELLRKSLLALCARRGLLTAPESSLPYFPAGLLKNDRLSLTTLTGEPTNFGVSGTRSYGRGERQTQYRYHLAPYFAPREREEHNTFDIIVRLHVHITDMSGATYNRHSANRRRKHLCKRWFNREWLLRTMGVMQYLAEGASEVIVGTTELDRLAVCAMPRTWQSPFRLDEQRLTGDPTPDELLVWRAEDEDDEDES